MPEWRNFVCGVMILIVPTSFMAQDANRGLLYSNGGTRLNKNSAPAVTAIFPDSLVQTENGYNARIDVLGSTVLIQSDTVVRFQGHELALEHGSVQLDTARAMEVIVGCVSVTPLTSDRTQYIVTDVDGKVRVEASKNNVQIHVHGGTPRNSKAEGSGDIIVREGEQATREELCKASANPARAPAGVTGGILTNPWVIGAAGTVVAIAACLGLCHSDQPISPSKP